MRLSSSEDRMIVAGVVLTQCQRVTDGQTDRRTDGFTIAKYDSVSMTRCNKMITCELNRNLECVAIMPSMMVALSNKLDRRQSPNVPTCIA